MRQIIQWEGDAAEWDAAVAADADGNFAQLFGWRRVMEEALGHRCYYWAAVDARGRIEGVLPLVRVRSRLFGRYLVSMPFLNGGGAVGPASARAALVAHAVTLARSERVDLFELRSRGTPAEGLAVSRRKITHVLPLPATTDALWSTLPSKVRNQIRRPSKDGLVAEIGVDQRSAFYDVFARHMRALGTPVLPAAWFAAVAEQMSDRVIFATVYDGDTPVAGGCGFVWRGGCEITWASARREWTRSAPNMLLYWSFLQEAIRRGATRFDFGRCTPGSATHTFKRQWGGEDVGLEWAQWRAGDVTATPSPERRIFRVAAACWRHLPLPVTNRLGPMLARSIP